MGIDSKVGVVAVADSREGKADPESIDPRNRTRLDEIRVAIKHDRYPIDLDKLASKMVDDEFVRSSDVS